jgi:aryl-alcohol dehydrogenase-like predicted oxidoreductase/histidinol phosphatase-like enzyme
MRLSTDPDRDEARGVAVLHAALDAGITFFDTADAYCRDDTETGHNERLIARALTTWRGRSATAGPGDRSAIVVATKGGLTRPEGRWIADGRGKHLRAACEASLRALDVSRLALYQLHAIDPRTPLATSVRALAALQRDGLIDQIGLCNVTVGQIEEARRIAEIAAVQVELNFWNDANVLSGVADYCTQHGIRLIAHRPLGGPARARRASKTRVLTEVAARHHASPQEIALAWLTDQSPVIVPVPGATRGETVKSIASVPAIRLTDEDRSVLRRGADPPPPARSAAAVVKTARAALPGDSEVVLIMGLPGAGKTTIAQTLVDRGFTRLSRDLEGGTLRGQLGALDRLLESGRRRLVLDNTYVSRKSRGAVLAWAAAAGIPVRCLWLSTSIEDAQVNAVNRMLSTYGRLLGPEEMPQAAKTDVNTFPPSVQFRYQRDLEPPDPSEGFSRIDVVPFQRVVDPTLTERAVIVWCDGVLTRSRSGRRAAVVADDLVLVDERAKVLRGYANSGWRLLGLAWRPEIGDEQITRADADAAIARLQELMAAPIDVRYCPHSGGPPVCWCRKPLPGLGAAFIQTCRLDPARCIYVGDGPQDPGFARRLGFQYRDAATFFARE